MTISESQFISLTEKVMDALPEAVARRTHNLAITVEDFPTAEQLKKTGHDPADPYALLGLYTGRVQSSRRHADGAVPDRIILFRVPIMQSCADETELKERIETTLRHELAHHFGSNEQGARRAETMYGRKKIR